MRDSACFVIRRSRPSLPAGAATAAPKTATATKPTKAATTTAAPKTAKATAASSPSATPTAETAGRNDDRKAPRTASSPAATSTQAAEKAQDQEKDEQEDPRRNPAAAISAAWIVIARDRCWRRHKRCIQLKVELLCKPLRSSESYELQPCAVVLLNEGRRRFATGVTSVRINDKSLGSATRRDPTMSASVLARLLGNEKDHHSGVSRGIPGSPDLADLPVASDLRRDLLHIARTDVGKRDDRYLARGFRSHIFRDALHALNCIGLKHVRKIVHQPSGRRDRDALEKEGEPGGSQYGNESCRRTKTDQNRSKYLLSLDFMVWQEVYLADDSHKT